MLDSELQAKLKKEIRVIKIVYGAMLVAVVIMLTCGLALRATGVLRESQEFGPSIVSLAVRIIFVVVSALSIFFVWKMGKFFPFRPGSGAKAEHFLGHFLTSHMIALVIGECPIFWGIILLLFGENAAYLVAGGIISFAILTIKFPRYKKLEQEITERIMHGELTQ